MHFLLVSFEERGTCKGEHRMSLYSVCEEIEIDIR